MQRLPMHKTSAEKFGEVMLDEIRSAAERRFDDIDLSRLSTGQGTVEIDVAIPFRIRMVTTSEGERASGAVCCICVSQNGTVTCLGECC